MSSQRQLSLAGVGGAAVFDCALRSHASSYAPAFAISSSNVTFSNLIIRNCGNIAAFGGAISASVSNVYILNCSFSNNRASSGGAVALSSGELLVVGSVFFNNTAVCMSSDCSSAWGGALAAFNAGSVNVTGSRFISNSAFLLSNASVVSGTFAVGGGCISVCFNQNSSATRVSISGNSLHQCVAQVMYAPSILSFFSGAFGGAVSIYHGLDPSATSPLVVSGATTEFTNNYCSSCLVSVPSAGNASVQIAGAHGGCLSIFVGNVGGNTGNVVIDGSLFSSQRNTITGCSATAYATQGVVSLGGGISISFGSVNTNTCVLSSPDQECVVGSLMVMSTRVIASSNNITDCLATASVVIIPDSEYVFGPVSAGGGTSIFAATRFMNTQFMTSDNSIETASLTDSIIRTDDNAIQNCRALSVLVGAPKVPVTASFTSGGGIGLQFGIVAYTPIFSTVVTGNVSFTGAIKAKGNVVVNCSAVLSSTSAYILPFDPLVFGGGISFFVGAHVFAHTTASFAPFVNFFGEMVVENNIITRCHAVVNFPAYGSMAAGGGISMHIGGHSQFFLYNVLYVTFSNINVIAPATLIGSNSRIICSGNTLTHCSAAIVSSTTQGGVARGGGISVMVGGTAAVVSVGSIYAINGIIAGNTAAGSNAYQVSLVENVVSHCIAIINSSISSSGALVSGGGMNIMIGPSCFSFSSIGPSACSAGDSFFFGSINISANYVSQCNASQHSNFFSTGSLVLGGCIAASVGASILANGGINSGGTTFSASLLAAGNMLSQCYIDSDTGGEMQASSAFGGECHQ